MLSVVRKPETLSRSILHEEAGDFGWPELSLMWRAQMEAFAANGWHCVAPDMRGYGGSSAPAAHDAYANEQVVADMTELHDRLGGQPAVWVMTGAAS